MTYLAILQITALMCFIYALRIRMYQNNLIGFVTIFSLLIGTSTSGLETVGFETAQYHSLLYIIATMLLIFIVIYHTYKTYQRRGIK